MKVRRAGPRAGALFAGALYATALFARGLFATALLVGCKVDEPAPTKVDDRPATAAPRVEVIAAPPGDVAITVQREIARASGEGRRVLVYVGASWCEPCQRFHDAAKRGELDATFPGLRVVEFDLDRDHDALAKAGYVAKMIPLFALPRPDGTATGQQIEGSIKGPGAVAQIAPRLSALLAKGP